MNEKLLASRYYAVKHGLPEGAGRPGSHPLYFSAEGRVVIWQQGDRSTFWGEPVPIEDTTETEFCEYQIPHAGGKGFYRPYDLYDDWLLAVEPSL